MSCRPHTQTYSVEVEVKVEVEVEENGSKLIKMRKRKKQSMPVGLFCGADFVLAGWALKAYWHQIGTKLA